MSSLTEVTVLNPGYWADKTHQLAALLGRAAARSPIGDPSGRAPDPETVATFVNPGYWAAQPRELQEVLNVAAGVTAEPARHGGLTSGAFPGTQERLTLTVEEAAAVLGISRAFAYESVRRGDIPHIKIGRRVLIPKKALEQLLESTSSDHSSPAPER